MLSYYLTIHVVARCLICCKHTLVKTAAQTLNSHHRELWEIPWLKRNALNYCVITPVFSLLLQTKPNVTWFGFDILNQFVLGLVRIWKKLKWVHFLVLITRIEPFFGWFCLDFWRHSLPTHRFVCLSDRPSVRSS